MIQKVHFENFKALVDVSLHLGRLTVLVGPNASGKTSVLEGLHYITQLACKPPNELFTGVRSLDVLHTKSGKRDLAMQVWVEADGTTGDLCLQTSFANQGGAREPRPEHNVEWSANWGEQRDKRGGGDQPLEAIIPELARVISSAVLLQLDPNQLASASYSDYPRPRVEYNGYGLASVLVDMLGSRRQAFDDLVRSVQAVIPTVKDIRLIRAPVERRETESFQIGEEFHSRSVVRKYSGNAVYFDFVGAPDVPAHATSEGTLLVLGLLTVLSGPVRPRLVLLDDIERGLHPKALGELVDQLRRILERTADMQIVATSHSPYLLDHLRTDEIRLSTVRDDGSVVFGSLEHHPDFERWKDLMSPGELWSTIGEDWLKEGKKRKDG